jgi:competence protein ComEA
MSRRPPDPGPAARQHSLARLRAATPASPADEGEEHVRGGWTPTPDQTTHSNRPNATTPTPAALPAHDSAPDAVRPDSLDRLRGPRWTFARWTLTPRHVVVLCLILATGLTWAGCSVLRSRPQPVPTPSGTLATGSPVANAPGVTTTPPTASPTGTSVATPVVVHVAGKVRHPGLIRTHTGARVADVLAAAGGPLPGTDLTTLNLARLVTDGEQILVGLPNQPPPPTPGAATTPSTGPVDLNTATLAQREDLPGVGPVLAQRILDYRTQNGPFTSVDQLQEVSGVGAKKFESLKPHVRV